MTKSLWKFLLSASLGFSSFAMALLANMHLYEYQILEIPREFQLYTNDLIVSVVLATLALITFISSCVSIYNKE
jgi:hypothetical protein